MNLNIVIPSYNRYEYLTKQLDRLKPQLNERTKVVVLDNASPDSRYQRLGEVYGFATLVHNPVNIGIVGNILRAYEYAPSGYLWMLSDDDWISSDAVAKIQKAISSNPEHIYLSFGGRGEKASEEGEKIYSSSEFIQSFSCVSTIGFISANVFSCAFVKEYMHQGYLAGRTLFPHVAIFFSALAQKGNVSVRIVKDCVSFNNGNNTYPSLQYMTFLNHFELGSFLNKSDEKKFRLFYIQTWGDELFGHSFNKGALFSTIRQMHSIREMGIFLCTCWKGGWKRVFHKIQKFIGFNQ